MVNACPVAYRVLRDSGMGSFGKAVLLNSPGNFLLILDNNMGNVCNTYPKDWCCAKNGVIYNDVSHLPAPRASGAVRLIGRVTCFNKKTL